MENNTGKKRKFNVVDLIFILIIVAALAAVGIKLVGNARAKSESAPYTVVLHSDEFPKTALGGFKVGDTVLDEVGKVFGTVKEIKDYGEARWDEKSARDVVGLKEDFTSADIIVEVSCTSTGNYIVVAGNKYYNNASNTYVVGMSKLWLRVSSIVEGPYRGE